MQNLESNRKSYERKSLSEAEMSENPMQQFRLWYAEAQEDPMIQEANAMSIATMEPDGCPRTRMVLLKSYDWDGFVFYTNFESRKGRALQENPHCCLHFFWPSQERQVIIKAKVEKVSEGKSTQYFHSRPRGSQLGAAASRQSRIVPDREYLDTALQELEKALEGKEIPKPDFWGGYLAKPYEIEFWQGRPNRMHDRILYSLEGWDWKISRLSP